MIKHTQTIRRQIADELFFRSEKSTQSMNDIKNNEPGNLLLTHKMNLPHKVKK